MVHGEIRVPEQGPGVRAVLGEAVDADGGGDGQLVALDDDRRVERAEQIGGLCFAAESRAATPSLSAGVPPPFSPSEK